MRWFKHKMLSKEDLDLLQGTRLITRMLRNRLVIVLNEKDAKNFEDHLNFDETQGMTHLRYLKTDKSVIEILFENGEDLETIQAELSMIKITKE